MYFLFVEGADSDTEFEWICGKKCRKTRENLSCSARVFCRYRNKREYGMPLAVFHIFVEKKPYTKRYTVILRKSYSAEIAPTGHSPSQAAQSMQASASIT